MPEVIPDHVPSPRTLLAWDGTAYRPVTIDAAGHLQIDVLTIAAGVDVATATNQALALTQLQLIEDMRDALQSVATDRLIVRGEDQVFSFRAILGSYNIGVISGAGGYFDSDPCDADRVWVVTNVVARDLTSATTGHRVNLHHAAFTYRVHEETAAFAAGAQSSWGGHLYMQPDDVIRVYFLGGLAADQCVVELTGYTMTRET